ncbi:Zinc finger MYM-type protein 1 [Folsomia candida]|uniref:Zinc finger MYM-type protein 1 n=1 Tax=Folsomia candida TaxID=158441 RepID=A0A226D576_FOLCA|nr:Zinc finger MYM-type protein 1 [Folsomia candida]
MGRVTNPNLKPVAERKEESGSQKDEIGAEEVEDFGEVVDSVDTSEPLPPDDQISVPLSQNETAAKSAEFNDGQNTFISSDPSTWPFVLSSSIQSILLKCGPTNIPEESYPKKGHYSFNPRQLKNGDIVRDWILYSNSTNSLFCFNCCLFAKTQSSLSNSPWANYGPGQIGFCDYQHQGRAIKEHERSQHHFQTTIQWRKFQNDFKKGTLIDQNLHEGYMKELGFWRKVLASMIEAVVFLVQNNLPFRGSSSRIQDDNCGIFLSLIKLLSKYNPTLALHISRLEHGKVNYMSPRTQNEFISIAGSHLRSSILKDIKSRKFFSLMLDSTPDISHSEQISFIVRTVAVSEEGCKIEENFIDFINFEGKTGEQITEMILKQIDEYQLDLKLCRGQGTERNNPKLSETIPRALF